MKVSKRVLEKIRKVLISDSDIKKVVKMRVYTKHISEVTDPVYPAISLFLLSNINNFSVRTSSMLTVQIDLWLQSGRNTQVDIMDLAENVSELLDRQDLTDSDIGIAIASISQETAGPIIIDPEPNLLHVPLIYQIAAFPTD